MAIRRFQSVSDVGFEQKNKESIKNFGDIRSSFKFG